MSLPYFLQRRRPMQKAGLVPLGNRMPRIVRMCKIKHTHERRCFQEVYVNEPTGKLRKRAEGQWDLIEPVGKRVVIRKDDNKRETKSGIVLPGNHEIPTLTGRVIAISKQIERDADFPIREYDKVLFDPRDAIPVEFEADNRLFVVPVERVLGIFRKTESRGNGVPEATKDAEEGSKD